MKDPEQSQGLAAVGEGRESVELGPGTVVDVRLQDQAIIGPMNEVVADQPRHLSGTSGIGLVIEPILPGDGIPHHRERVSRCPTGHHRILFVIGPADAVGREGGPDTATFPIPGLPIAHLVPAVGVRVLRIPDHRMVPVVPAQDDVVGLGAAELHVIQLRLLPPDPVLGGGITDELLDVGVAGSGQRVVPHLENFLFRIVDHAPRLKDQVTLPGPVWPDQGVPGYLSSPAQTSPDPVHPFDEQVIDEQLDSIVQPDGRVRFRTRSAGDSRQQDAPKENCQADTGFHFHAVTPGGDHSMGALGLLRPMAVSKEHAGATWRGDFQPPIPPFPRAPVPHASSGVRRLETAAPATSTGKD